MNSSNSAKSSTSRGVPLIESVLIVESIEKIIRSDPTPRLSCFLFTRITAFVVCRKGLPKIRGTLLSSSILRIMKSTRKVNLPTSTSIFSVIPTGYWNDRSANRTLIWVGLRVSRVKFAYREYDIRLMLAQRSAKTLQEKVLLKVQGIRKLPGSLSLGATVGSFIIAFEFDGNDVIYLGCGGSYALYTPSGYGYSLAYIDAAEVV
ncbi:hypothetical protein Tco_0875338 [Tanacetum coccineum]|uniref:Uncharacterized protein n=1 Tax=Tanacetum coccineum TaxID=301880 RepID=A0ABQ5BS44_9ASTR